MCRVLDGRPREQRGAHLEVVIMPWLGQDNTERIAGKNIKYGVITLELGSNRRSCSYSRSRDTTRRVTSICTNTSSSVELMVHHRQYWELLSYSIHTTTHYLPLDISSCCFSSFPPPSLLGTTTTA